MMLRRVASALVLLLCVSAGASAQTAGGAGMLHVMLRGEWRGTLEYKDYQKPDKRVKLPTLLTVANGFAEGVSMHWVYDDGPGKTVIEDDRFVMSADGRTVDWTGLKDKEATIFTVTSQTRAADGSLVITMERDGTDDNKPARIRDTITLRLSAFTLLKEVRFGAGEPFTFRHEYRMTR